MRPSPIKIKFFIALAAVFGVASIFLGTFLYLFLSQISPLSEQFLSVQKSIKTADEQINTYKILVAPDLEKNEDELKRVEALFFSEGRAFEFIVFLEQLAGANELTHSISSPPTEQAPQTTVQVTGTLTDILTFVNSVENGAFLVRISRLDITLRGDGSANASLDLVLKKL